MVHHLVSLVYVGLHAVVQHFFNEEWVRFIADFEHIGRFEKSKPFLCGLKIVEGLPHVSLRGEHDGLQPVIRVLNVLCLEHIKDVGKHLGI